MMEEYDMFEFGPDNDHFGDIVIYVRRPRTLCQEERQH